jgi:cell wall-associated NlpC family hydrolase
LKPTAKGKVKAARKSVKTAEKSAKAAVKTAQKTAKAAQETAKAAIKTAKVAERVARIAVKAAAKAAKTAAKAVTAVVKAAISAVKGLAVLIAAGGWVAVLVILVVCLVALLVGSIFGIFFSSEPDPGSGMSINGAINEINTEYAGKVDAIISGNAHDLLDMSGARAAWKQVLSIYTVRTVTDPDNPMEVATMNGEKAAILRAVFWDMNAISHSLESFDVEVDVLDDEGLPTGDTETATQTVLRIVVSHKTPDEMASQYGFNSQQAEWLAELLKPEYHSLWNALLFGITSIGDGSLIEIADMQVGNVGGEVYWRWYGFSDRVPWCAIFVSWVAEQAGLIDAGIIPRFASCAAGIQWFRDRGQWFGSDYTPRPGDLIFFDWEPDGVADHVGIVERVEGDYVHAIEGNTSDSVRRRTYRLDSNRIFGYGVPIYN